MDIISLFLGLFLLFAFIGTSQTAKSILTKKQIISKQEEIVKYKI
jgi:hypothetical protein